MNFKFSSLLMILIPSVKLYRLYLFFLKKIWRTLILFVGSLIYSCFWTSVDACPGFQSQSESLVCVLRRLSIMTVRTQKLRKGYVFTGVCLSMGGGVHPPGQTP